MSDALEADKLKVEKQRLKLEEQKIKVEQDKIVVEREKMLASLGAHRSTITNNYALAALRTVLLINGAAVIATLAFLGSTADKNLNDVTIDTARAKWALFVFAIGVASAAFAVVGGYLTRTANNDEEIDPRKRYTIIGKLTRKISTYIGIASLPAFCYGSFELSRSFLNSNSHFVVRLDKPTANNFSQAAVDEGRTTPELAQRLVIEYLRERETKKKP